MTQLTLEKYTLARGLLTTVRTSLPLTVNTFMCISRMKRRDLEKTLRALGWWLLRHGGNHDIWTDGDAEEAIPRHRELNERLAQTILRRARGER